MLDECGSCASVQEHAEYCAECGVSLFGCRTVDRAQHVRASLLDAINKGGAKKRLRAARATPDVAPLDASPMFNLNLALSKQRAATEYSDDEDTEDDWGDD